jgi:hypothetical protein
MRWPSGRANPFRPARDGVVGMMVVRVAGHRGGGIAKQSQTVIPEAAQRLSGTQTGSHSQGVKPILGPGSSGFALRPG